MLLTGWRRLMCASARREWVAMFAGMVSMCGVGVVVVGEDGGEWGSEMGPRQGSQQHRRDTGPTTWA